MNPEPCVTAWMQWTAGDGIWDTIGAIIFVIVALGGFALLLRVKTGTRILHSLTRRLQDILTQIKRLAVSY